MRDWLGRNFIFSIILGAILGTVGMAAWHWLFWPTVLGDGQYGMVVPAFSVPGAAILLAWTNVRAGSQRRGANLLALAIGSCVPWLALMFMSMSNPYGDPSDSELGAILFYLPAWLQSVGLLVFAIYVIRVNRE